MNELVRSLLDFRDKFRLASLNLTHAGDWWNTQPSSAFALRLFPLSYPVQRLEAPSTLKMARIQVIDMCYALACGSDVDRKARHTFGMPSTVS